PDSRGAPAASRRATPGTVWPRASSPRRGPRAADRVMRPAPASTSRPYGRMKRAEGAARAGDRVSQAATQGGRDLLLLSSRGEQPAERAHLLGGALQHLGLALPMRPLGPHDLGPRLGDRALEGATKTGGDVSLGRSGERRIHRVEATGDAREAGDRGVDVARRRIADAVVGAEVAIVAGEGHAGHAGTARARLDAVAHVLVVAARDPGAGERVVHASGDRIAGIVGARIAVVAHERRNGGADTGGAGGARALAAGGGVRGRCGG